MIKKYLRMIVIVLCLAVLAAFASCQTSQSASQRYPGYQKDRVRYRTHWNAAGSPTTTYHIKKHFKRNPRDRKKAEY